MANMTYKELIESIEKAKEESRLFTTDRWGGENIEHYAGREFDVLERIAAIAYSAGYDDAAKDPESWHVLDKNGEEVYIGDKVRLANGEEYTVKGIYSDENRLCVLFFDCSELDGYTVNACEKVIPDSREKIEGDFSEWFGSITDFSDKTEADKMFKSFMDRCAALEGE